MIKISNKIHSLWPQIHSKLKNPPSGMMFGNVSSKIPSMDKIKLDQGTLPGNAQAVGYVTTEDTDNNGELDTIHISTSRLEELLRNSGIDLNKINNLNELSNDDLMTLLSPFVELISHESGHLNDYKKDSDNPFPGGESVAESAARSALQQISVATTNNKISVEAMEQFNMEKETLDILISLADKLDKLNAKGTSKIADRIDEAIAKFAQMQPTPVPMGEDYADQNVTQKSVYDEASGQYKPVISDKRLAPQTKPWSAARSDTSKQRFTADTGIPADDSLQNIKAIQQKLIEAKYDIGAKTPDMDWGPKSTAAWTKFYSDSMDKMPAADKQGFISRMDSGDLSKVITAMTMATDVKELAPKLAPTPETFAALAQMETAGDKMVRARLTGPAVLRMLLNATPREMSSFTALYPDLFAKTKDHLAKLSDETVMSTWGTYSRVLEPETLNMMKSLFQDSYRRRNSIFMKAHPGAIPNVSGLTDAALPNQNTDVSKKTLNQEIEEDMVSTNLVDDATKKQLNEEILKEMLGTAAGSTEEKIKKIASDTEKYREIFWHEFKTPFGR
jgi:hypothetical protein